MVKQLSEDLKWHIVYHLVDGYTQRETAERLYISIGVVSKVWEIYKSWGCVIDPFRKTQGRKKTFNTYDMKVNFLISFNFFYNQLFILILIKKVLQELVKEKVDWFLDELVYEMAQRTGKIVSIPTLWRSLNFCGITRKKVRKYLLISSMVFYNMNNYILL